MLCQFKQSRTTSEEIVMYTLFKDEIEIIRNQSMRWLAHYAMPHNTMKIIFNDKYILPKGYTIEEIKE